MSTPDLQHMHARKTAWAKSALVQEYEQLAAVASRLAALRRAKPVSDAEAQHILLYVNNYLQHLIPMRIEQYGFSDRDHATMHIEQQARVAGRTKITRSML